MQEQFSNYSRTRVKKMLQHGQFIIDGRSITQFNHPLKDGQVVYVLSQRESKQIDYLENISIIYEDNELVVIEKEAGLLSVPTDDPTPDEDSALIQLMGYLKEIDPTEQIYSVHRLDRDTSGVMLFSKNKSIQEMLQANWGELVKTRAYTAVVEGDFPHESGTYSSWLKELDNMQMVSSQTDNRGKFSETKYRKIKSNKNYSLLEVELITGRRNQIRVHMKDLGHPVVGDSKYGDPSNPIKRLGLHASKLELIHPITEESMVFESEAPQKFLELVK
jgi:23S rRNA pseudouridine1911/1915/1917 synthase